MAQSPLLTVFLSHSFNDNSTLYALEARLDPKEFYVIHDTERPETPALHKAISSNLNRCDVVVPIITKNWLISHECRDELIRANERRKIIIPFFHKDLRADTSVKLPWYLVDNLHISWTETELQRAISDLVNALRGIASDIWQQTCYRNLRIIGDHIQHSEKTPVWKSQLCHEILEVAESQMRRILATNECDFPVSSEQAYFRFADPIFGRAETIIAVCIASISTFWTHPDFRSYAGKYLKKQDKSASSICRLFVFDSVAEVTNFRPMLQKHHLLYGKDTARGGVFLCSTTSYKKLLSKWLLDIDENAMRKDFGLLTFGNQNEKVYASLDAHLFRYAEYEEDNVDYIKYRLVIEQFESLRSLKLGGVDEKAGIFRWAPEWERDDEEFASALEQMFLDRACPATHIVLLKLDGDAKPLEGYLQQLASRFYRERQALNIRSVLAKRRCDLVVSDGRYAAPLLREEDFDYLLVMEFDNKQALEHYYQHELHSLEREKLYILLNPAVKPRFDEAAQLHRSQVGKRAAIFSEIETEMARGRFIRRFDVYDDNSVAHLISLTNS